MIRYRIIDFLRGTDIDREIKNIKFEISMGRNYLLKVQKTKLVQLLKYVKNTDFYSPYLKTFQSKDLEQKPYEILSFLPFVDKKMILDNFGKLFYPNSKKYEMKFTGGSTGKPFRYPLDKKSISRNLGYLYYFWWRNGYNLGDIHLVLGGESLASKGKKVKKFVYNKLLNRIFINSDILDEVKYQDIIRIINNKKLKTIYSYPSSLQMFINYNHHNNKRGTGYTGIIFTTSEMLNQAVRLEIESFFGVDVIDQYGANDGGIVASQCKNKNGYHYNMQDCYVETYYNKDCNCMELVVTNLNSYSLPFIRYKVGDCGILETKLCSCGLPLDRISQLWGRTRDVVKFDHNLSIHGSYFNQIIKEYKSIKRYQIIQKTKRRLLILIDVDLEHFDKKGFLHDISLIIPIQEIEIDLKYTNKFLYDKNKKFRNLISHVN